MNGETLSYSYDALSRVLSETQPLGTVGYTNDNASRRTQVTWPGSGFYVNYDYNTVGEVTAIRQNNVTSGAGVDAEQANCGRAICRFFLL